MARSATTRRHQRPDGGRTGQQVVEDLRAILRVRESHVETLERILQIQIELGPTRRCGATGCRGWPRPICPGAVRRRRARADAPDRMEPDVSQHAEKLEFVRIKLRSPMRGAGGRRAAAESSFAALPTPATGAILHVVRRGRARGSGVHVGRAGRVRQRAHGESDVFIKYGLVDKAIEQLQAIIGRTRDAATRQKLVRYAATRTQERRARAARGARGNPQAAGDAAASARRSSRRSRSHPLIRPSRARSARPPRRLPLPLRRPAARSGRGSSVEASSSRSRRSRSRAAAACRGFEISLDAAGGGVGFRPLVERRPRRRRSARRGGRRSFEISLDDEPAGASSSSSASTRMPGRRCRSARCRRVGRVRAVRGCIALGGRVRDLDGRAATAAAPSGAGELEVPWTPSPRRRRASSRSRWMRLRRWLPGRRGVRDRDGVRAGSGRVNSRSPSTPAGPWPRAEPAGGCASPAPAPRRGAVVPPAARLSTPLPCGPRMRGGLFGERDDFFNFATKSTGAPVEESLTEVSRGDDRA